MWTWKTLRKRQCGRGAFDAFSVKLKRFENALVWTGPKSCSRVCDALSSNLMPSHAVPATTSLAFLRHTRTTLYSTFPRFSLVTCFPPLVAGHMFSHACHWSHVFPRFSLVTCFPALSTGYMFSRAFHRFHGFCFEV